jgi:hypothetical protein
MKRLKQECRPGERLEAAPCSAAADYGCGLLMGTRAVQFNRMLPEAHGLQHGVSFDQLEGFEGADA